MTNVKNGVSLVCKCGKSFYRNQHEYLSHEKHFCSQRCMAKYTAPDRAKKLLKKEYPFVFGPCMNCGNDIVIRNSGFDKPDRKFCSNKCITSYRNKTNNPSRLPRVRKLLSDNCRARFKNIKKTTLQREHMGAANRGNKSHFWKGGLTVENMLLRNGLKTKLWREKVFNRDDFTCQVCGARNGNGKSIYLSAHHIKAWYKYPEQRWELDNGITLCVDCHRKTDNFGNKKV